jgi:hypothetical protein
MDCGHTHGRSASAKTPTAARTNVDPAPLFREFQNDNPAEMNNLKCVLHFATPVARDFSPFTPPGLFTPLPPAGPYHGIADTIVQLFAAEASGVIVSREQSRCAQRK